MIVEMLMSTKEIMQKNKRYTIKKTLKGRDIQVILNDSLGAVAYFTFDDAIAMCQILNANSR